MRLADGAQVTGALQTGTLSTRTVVHSAALVPLTTPLPARAGLSDRVRGRDRRLLGAQDRRRLGRAPASA